MADPVNELRYGSMKLGFLCKHNALDRGSFSGTPHYMFHALREHPDCSVRLLGQYRPPNRVLDKLRRSTPGLGEISARSFEGLDVVLSLVSTELVTKYAAVTQVPIIHCTDATPGFLRDFYGRDVSADRDELERRAYEQASLVLFSSEFMLECAVSEFGGAFRSKMAALPWGGNLDRYPKAPPPKPPLRPLRLLFIGRDWERKGGDVAVATLRELHARGVCAELHVVGAEAGTTERVPGMISHGFLDKNRRADRKRLTRLLNDSHLLILPTRADCTPMVVAEANSHATPVLITDVGGVASLMDPGRNGRMLPRSASPADYADGVMALTADPGQYTALSRDSFGHFVKRLTWPAWSSAAVTLFRHEFVAQRIASV